MGGIAGIVLENNMNDLSEIVTMTDVIKHRGADGFGFYYDTSLAFGHRRLSITDHSEKGKQPMEYIDKYIITFNGEIYNYLELKDELSSNGYVFESTTDTEVILASYDYWGKECLNKFNGMWSFAIYDKGKNIIFCSRDRFGEKPFYYTFINKNFMFGSEIKQFCQLKGFKVVANKYRLNDYIIKGGARDFCNETMFRGVYQLSGGEYLEFDLISKTHRIERWYSLIEKIKTNKAINEQEIINSFKELFYDAVRIRMRPDVRFGSCLSGGLDSSSIVCVMDEILSAEGLYKNQETVSMCCRGSKFDEGEYIDDVVKKTKATAHIFGISYQELFCDLDKILWYQDEPFPNASVFAQYKVYEMARQNGLIVMMDGLGGDVGYGSYDAYLRELLFNFKFIELYNKINDYSKLRNNSQKNIYKNLLLAVIVNLLPKGSIKVYRRYNKGAKREIINDNGSFDRVANNKGIAKSILEESMKEILITALPRLLHHLDRNSMVHSVEARTPLLDYRLVEFILSLENKYKINGTTSKYILREALDGVLPITIRNRTDKNGFGTPAEDWFRQNKEDFEKEFLDACECLKSVVNINVLKKASIKI